MAEPLIVPSQTHPIDNLSTELEFSFGDERVGDAWDPSRPLHFDGGITEGQTETLCLTNASETTPVLGQTMQETHAMYWSLRRHIINKLYFLIGQVNRIKAKSPGMPVPFYDYDPFFNGEPHHPGLVDAYNFGLPGLVLGPYAWDGIQIRFDWFLDAQALDLNSHQIGAPQRGEGGFLYWDRIPAHPIMDACAWWQEGRISFTKALRHAEAHCFAGVRHLTAIVRRILYVWPLEFTNEK